MIVATYNLRYDSMPDNITVSESIRALGDPLLPPQKYLTVSNAKEQPWSVRRLRVAEQLLSEGIEIVGFQEALKRQVDDIAELFGEHWGWVGIGRDDGESAGEFSPVFYKKSAMTLLSTDTFWTSKTPFKPSKYPGAGSVRICTVAQFTLTSELDSASTQTQTQTRMLSDSHPSPPRRTVLTILNTHMDDQSDDQRALAASLILIRVRYEAVCTKGPVLVLGDFNSESTGATSTAYKIITGATPSLSDSAIDEEFLEKYAVRENELSGFRMLDLRGEVPAPLRHLVSRDYATFTGFRRPEDTKEWCRIDFVFGGSNSSWSVGRYKVGTSLSDDGVLASDHRPVFVDVALQ